MHRVRTCLRFSSGDPLDMTYKTIINSLKSMLPSWLESYIRKMCFCNERTVKVVIEKYIAL